MTLKIVSGPENAPLTPLLNRTVAVLGYGNQGSAHALNLRDSGLTVLVANRPDSPNGRRARQDGFELCEIEQAVAAADLVIIALPDEAQGQAWRERIGPHLTGPTIVGFLHGFAIRYRLVEPPPNVGVIMVAPKGPGHALRRRYQQGQGIPCLLAVHQDLRGDPGRCDEVALAWAGAIGCARAAIVYTSFAHETETDLFGEQSVLCGGLMALIIAAFEQLAEAGYPPELAYMECCQEVKQIADLVFAGGLAKMMAAISNTAEFGAYRAGPALVDEHVRQRMREVLAQVRDGGFAKALRDDYAAGFPWFQQQREALRRHPIEQAGQAIRALMPWLGGDAASGAARGVGKPDAGRTQR